jgi:hypothetical protein
LETLRTLIQIYFKDEKKTNFKESSAKMISTYKMQDNIKSGKFNQDTYYNENLDEIEFKGLVSGKNTKETLFSVSNNRIDSKRQNIEMYTKLYFLMGGNNEGISRDNLAKCIAVSVNFSNNPEDMIKYDSPINYNEYYTAAESIIKNLARTRSDMLSPEDFINIMTSQVDLE